MHACTLFQPFLLDIFVQEEAARVYNEEAYPDIIGRHLLPSHVAPVTINQEVAAAARATFEDDRSFGRGGSRVSGMTSRFGPCSVITQLALCVYNMHEQNLLRLDWQKLLRFHRNRALYVPVTCRLSCADRAARSRPHAPGCQQSWR